MAPPVHPNLPWTRDCLDCCLLPYLSSKSFAQRFSHIGAQFYMLHQSEVPDHQLVTSQLQKIDTVGVQSKYQLARFLDEPADYKSLVVEMEHSTRLRRRAAHIVSVTKQTEGIDSLLAENKPQRTIKPPHNPAKKGRNIDPMLYRALYRFFDSPQRSYENISPKMRAIQLRNGNSVRLE